MPEVVRCMWTTHFIDCVQPTSMWRACCQDARIRLLVTAVDLQQQGAIQGGQACSRLLYRSCLGCH